MEIILPKMRRVQRIFCLKISIEIIGPRDEAIKEIMLKR
jgi:hypothetical protein